jgi:hypothetical protein
MPTRSIRGGDCCWEEKSGVNRWDKMTEPSHRSSRVMKYGIGKLGEELHIQIVGKHLPFDWSGS